MAEPAPLTVTDAATLSRDPKEPTKNQDSYAHGPGWAAVADGASSWGPRREHDGGWYSQRLTDALARELNAAPTGPGGEETFELVARAITEAGSAHNAADGPCPFSTLSLLRWDDQELESYTLGDSYTVVFRDGEPDDDPWLYVDRRMEVASADVINRFRERLIDGHGYDDEHHELLLEFQATVVAARNTEGGFWTASDNPDAARRGYLHTLPTSEVRAVLLASDGVVDMDDSKPVWARFLAPSAAASLERVYSEEAADPDGQKYPRSKRHDDKTLIKLTR